MKTLIQKDICTSVFTAALFTIGKVQKQPVSNNRQMDKEDVAINIYIYTYTHTYIYTTWMNLECYTKRSQSDRERQMLCVSLICEISKTEQVNKHSKQK